MKIFTAICLLMLLAGCDSPSQSPRQELQISVPENLSPGARQLINDAWPKVLRACPGLKKYGGVLKFEGIEDSLNMPDDEYKKVTIKFMVPDGQSDIPSSYYAWGHHCFLDIDSAGKTVSIAKGACKAVCLDQVIKGTIHDDGADLVLPLQ